MSTLFLKFFDKNQFFFISAFKNVHNATKIRIAIVISAQGSTQKG